MVIAGVPEHFNLPWHLAPSLKSELHSWQDCPGGTGEMLSLLNSESVDLAIVLTEGILKDKQQGCTAEILEIYVDSPLWWGIHCDARSSFQSVGELENRPAGISRVGSGSELMLKVLADTQKWNSTEIPKVVLKDLKGLVEGVCDGRADYFLWEKFMTKPLVDEGTLRRLGDCPSPWPSFVIVATKKALNAHHAQILSLIEEVKQQAEFVKNSDQGLDLLSENYQLKRKDVEEWRHSTSWFGKPWSKNLELEILEKMKHYGIV